MPEAVVGIEELAPSGEGVARVGARTIFVPFTLPGERVRVSLPPFDVRVPLARLLEVIRASPHRVMPGCVHFGPEAVPGLGPCGGCAWQHIAYAEQLRLKTALVDRLVESTVRGAPRAAPMLAGTPLEHPWGFRQKAHFVFGEDASQARAARGRTRARSTGPVVMGHYARGTRRVIPVRECPVHDARGNEMAFELGHEYARSGIEPWTENGDGDLQSVAVRTGLHTDEIQATVVVARGSDKRLRTATRRVMERVSAPSYHLNLHPEPDGYVFGERTRTLSGSERLREQVGGASFLVSPTAFFQTNIAAAEMLVRLVLEALPQPGLVLDLYAGAGLFAIPLALTGHIVTAVEENRTAVADGIASTRLNGLGADRCRFVARRAEAVLASADVPDAVVLDPPRDGCTPEVIDGVFGDLRPRTAVYVSCNPEALAADLAEIVRCGYTIRSMQPVDMFPHTAHIETLVVLTR